MIAPDPRGALGKDMLIVTPEGAAGLFAQAAPQGSNLSSK